MKRFDIAAYFEDKPRVAIEEHFDGDYCKYSDVEQLQALTKEFAKGIVRADDESRNETDFSFFCNTHDHDQCDDCVVTKAQQYLDSIKE